MHDIGPRAAANFDLTIPHSWGCLYRCWRKKPSEEWLVGWQFFRGLSDIIYQYSVPLFYNVLDVWLTIIDILKLYRSYHMCSNMLNAFFGAAVPPSIGVRIGALRPSPSPSFGMGVGWKICDDATRWSGAVFRNATFWNSSWTWPSIESTSSVWAMLMALTLRRMWICCTGLDAQVALISAVWICLDQRCFAIFWGRVERQDVGIVKTGWIDLQ